MLHPRLFGDGPAKYALDPSERVDLFLITAPAYAVHVAMPLARAEAVAIALRLRAILLRVLAAYRPPFSIPCSFCMWMSSTGPMLFSVLSCRPSSMSSAGTWPNR
jgi:hypothetical protein